MIYRNQSVIHKTYYCEDFKRSSDNKTKCGQIIGLVGMLQHRYVEITLFLQYGKLDMFFMCLSVTSFHVILSEIPAVHP